MTDAAPELTKRRGMSPPDAAAWTAVSGLDDVAAGNNPERPLVKVHARVDGATVVRIAFTGGQTMPDHQAAQPILIVGQRGSVDVAVDGTTTAVTPGVALHIAAHVRHELSAAQPAAVTLLVLNPTA